MLEPSIADLRRFWSKVDIRPNGCWIWDAGLDVWGYGVFWLPPDNNYKAHRVAWLWFVGDIPEEVLVLHDCDTPPCVNPSHLHLGDHEMNMNEMYSRGRGRKVVGVAHHNARLDENKVRQIRELAQSMTTTQLARRFGVERNTIRLVVERKTWRHVC